ncbi:MAG: glycosyltransferase family 4 protein [Williamsia sp.]|nr:glycosyltransferase family 4 protein [Williamsia sp.]
MGERAGKLIAFVSYNAWTMYNFRLEVLKNFLDRGFRVLIIAEEDEWVEPLRAMGCEFVPVKIRNRSLNPFHDLELFFKLKHIYKKHRPDLIFHYVAKPNIYGTAAAGQLRIPSIAVITGLGHAFNKANLLRGLIKSMYRYALQLASEVWCLNKEDAEYFVHHNLVPVQKLKVLSGEGVNTQYFNPAGFVQHPEELFTFLLSARLLKSKGILEYADAALILKRKNYPVHCYLLGAVEEHPDAIGREQIDKWQQERGIKYLGFTKDVRPYLAKADCFVYPSYYNEGVPRSLLEACSMELPVITTDNTGCKELVEVGVSGLLCKKKDRFELAARMEEMLLMEKERRTAMGKRGREIVQAAYSVELIIRNYNSTVDQFLNPLD